MGSCISFYTRGAPTDKELRDKQPPQKTEPASSSLPIEKSTTHTADMASSNGMSGMLLRSQLRLPPCLRHSFLSASIRSYLRPLNLRAHKCLSSSSQPKFPTISSTHPLANAPHLSLSTANSFDQALQQNKQWAQTTARTHPSLFPTLATGQHPSILWLGCSDSRVPETTVLGLQPGDVFVHRNIANVLPPTDLSSQSVIMYAVEHLKVKHVVVCGHTSCGGVAAALGNSKLGIIDAWLTPIRKLRMQMAGMKGWEALDAKEKALRLVEANVRQGVQTLRENAEVIEARKERGLVVHGLIYDIANGELRELDCVDAEHERLIREDAFHTN